MIDSKHAGPSISQENVAAPVDGFENRLLNQIANKERLRPHTGVIRSNKPRILHVVEPLLSGSSERSSPAKISVGELDIRASIPMEPGVSQPDADVEASRQELYYGQTISTTIDNRAANLKKALHDSAKDYSTQLGGRSLADTRFGTDTRPSTQIMHPSLIPDKQRHRNSFDIRCSSAAPSRTISGSVAVQSRNGQTQQTPATDGLERRPGATSQAPNYSRHIMQAYATKPTGSAQD